METVKCLEKRHLVVVVQNQVNSVESVAQSLPSFDVELFEILPFDFETIPKRGFEKSSLKGWKSLNTDTVGN